MTFTILQSVYKNDKPQFLQECLQSIKDSTVQPVKIILVKDGSLPSELEQVISSWQDLLPLHVVGYEQNMGLAHALNYGLQFVDTELVARMDSDDLCYPDRFEKQILHFKMDEKLVILGTGIEEFYHDSKDDLEYRKVRLYPKRTTIASHRLYRGTPVAHPTVMARTTILKQFGYSESTRCNEDIELWFRLLQAGYEIKSLQLPLLRFRITDGTFRRRSLEKSLNEFHIYSGSLFQAHGLNRHFLYLFLRLASRLVPGAVNRRLYLSETRTKLFKEDFMKITSVHGHVFMKAGHLFEALVEFEESGVRMIKAIQLDSDLNNTIEIPLSEIKMYRLKDHAEIQLNM